jgi:hypothetical protein
MKVNQFLKSSNYTILFLLKIYHQEAEIAVHFNSQTRIILTKHLPTSGSTPNPVSFGISLQYNVQVVAGEIFTSEEHLLG